MKNWYAIYVRSRTEKKVIELLKRKKVEYYIPLKKELRQWSDRKKWVEFPVIPGYAFVNITPKERLNILETDYVLGFVRFMGKDAIIPEVQINCMKLILNQQKYEIDVNFTNYIKGQEIKIISGPLTGLIGNLVQVRNKQKVMVQLQRVSVNILVEIPGCHIQIIENKKLLAG